VSLAADVSILPLATSACPPSLTPSPLAYCTVANEFARTHIEELKPDVVVLAQAKDHERADFEGLVAWLTRVGVKHVVVMGPVPQWQPDLYKVIARHYWPEPPARIQTHLSKSAFAADRALRARMAGRAVTFVSVIDQLCNEQGCLAYLDGDRREGLTTFDYGHLSARGSAFVVKGALEPALAPLLRP
jgi:hypothetical protein